ncbi:hypothetical protein NDU88_003878 [Pleurodeles waltl]|uniref:Uncharacterized protein n=1 Tax=Pleurodeles waltl TaxID=8319 RepID=A0AAV7WQC7_PLEWA|nr:hypothetical protein NDU88_003878 [Pleurodeles waltl]
MPIRRLISALGVPQRETLRKSEKGRRTTHARRTERGRRGEERRWDTQGEREPGGRKRKEGEPDNRGLLTSRDDPTEGQGGPRRQ